MYCKVWNGKTRVSVRDVISITLRPLVVVYSARRVSTRHVSEIRLRGPVNLFRRPVRTRMKRAYRNGRRELTVRWISDGLGRRNWRILSVKAIWRRRWRVFIFLPLPLMRIFPPKSLTSFNLSFSHVHAPPAVFSLRTERFEYYFFGITTYYNLACYDPRDTRRFFRVKLSRE